MDEQHKQAAQIIRDLLNTHGVDAIRARARGYEFLDKIDNTPASNDARNCVVFLESKYCGPLYDTQMPGIDNPRDVKNAVLYTEAEARQRVHESKARNDLRCVWFDYRRI
jgi:hypothetical protein